MQAIIPSSRILHDEVMRNISNKTFLKNILPQLAGRIISENVDLSRMIDIYFAYANIELPLDLKVMFLFAAVRLDKEVVATRLLKTGANPNSIDHLQRTPLHIAAEMNFSKVATLLLTYGANLDACVGASNPDFKGMTAAEIAIRESSSDTVEVFERWKAKVKVIDGIRQRTIEVPLQEIKTLANQKLTSKVDLLSKDARGNTILQRSILQEVGLERLKQLIAQAKQQQQLKPFLNSQNQLGNTALILAARLGASEVVQLLIENGADPSIQGDEERTALHWAAFENDSRSIFSLVRQQDVEDENGFTPLHLAVCGFSLSAFKTLLSLGADMQAKDQYGNNAYQVMIKLYYFLSSCLQRKLDVSQAIEADAAGSAYPISYLAYKLDRSVSVEAAFYLLTEMIKFVELDPAVQQFLATRETLSTQLGKYIFSPRVAEVDQFLPIQDGKGNKIPFLPALQV